MFLPDLLVFAYFSPETFLPLTSVIASAVGVFLLFGSHVMRIARRALRVATGRGRKGGTIPRPHFQAQSREVLVESLDPAEQHTAEDSA